MVEVFEIVGVLLDIEVFETGSLQVAVECVCNYGFSACYPGCLFMVETFWCTIPLDIFWAVYVARRVADFGFDAR